jgi:polyisoprenoid-binding protein YceI
MSAQIWNFDTTHSGINFSVRHMVFAKVRGRFSTWSGSIRVEPDDPTTASVEVEIDATSIDTGVGDRDKHLRSADFLNVEQFPKVRFKSGKIERASAEQYKVHGSLTIRDVSKDVVLNVEYNGQAKDPWGNTRAALTAKTAINRTEFGLTWNQALEAGGVLVGEKIEIELEVQAVLSA